MPQAVDFKHHFDHLDWIQGQIHHQEDHVHTLRWTGPDSLEADVQSPEESCHVTLNFSVFRKTTQLQGFCSCRKTPTCGHMAAVLLHATQTAPKKPRTSRGQLTELELKTLREFQEAWRKHQKLGRSDAVAHPLQPAP